jgi:hypothetical protein
MNVQTLQFRTSNPSKTASFAPSAPAQLKPRERDFGIGYGKSSGYGSNRRYASDCVQPLFRCA